MNFREELNKLDHKCLDEGLRFYDLRTMYEAVDPKLTAQDKTELKQLLNSTNDPNMVVTFLQTKAAEKNEEFEPSYAGENVGKATEVLQNAVEEVYPDAYVHVEEVDGKVYAEAEVNGETIFAAEGDADLIDRIINKEFFWGKENHLFMADKKESLCESTQDDFKRDFDEFMTKWSDYVEADQLKSAINDYFEGTIDYTIEDPSAKKFMDELSAMIEKWADYVSVEQYDSIIDDYVNDNSALTESLGHSVAAKEIESDFENLELEEFFSDDDMIVMYIKDTETGEGFKAVVKNPDYNDDNNLSYQIFTAISDELDNMNEDFDVTEPSDFASNGHSYHNNPEGWEEKAKDTKEIMANYGAKLKASSPWGSTWVMPSGRQIKIDYWEDKESLQTQLNNLSQDESLTEDCKSDVIDWLSDHETAYNDALNHFEVDNLEGITEEDIIDWIKEHDQLSADFDSFFNKTEALCESENTAWVEEWWGQTEEDPEDFAASYNLDIEKKASKGDETLYRFTGSREDINRAMDDGYFYSVDYDPQTKTSDDALDDKEKEIVDEIADRYNTSKPVSGNWDTEATHERNAIMKALGCDEYKANKIMIDYLGFDSWELEESCNEDFDNPAVDWREEEDNERFPSHRYEKIKSKSVTDYDGFNTDYTMYYDVADDKYVFIFGDSDIYDADNSDADWECDTKEEAEEWFDSYTGLEEDE